MSDNVQFNFGNKVSHSPTFLLKHICAHFYCVTAILVSVKWGHVHIQQPSAVHSLIRLGCC